MSAPLMMPRHYRESGGAPYPLAYTSDHKGKSFNKLISTALSSAAAPATIKKCTYAVKLYKKFTVDSSLSLAEAMPASEVGRVR
jgi:hypothetical protein